MEHHFNLGGGGGGASTSVLYYRRGSSRYQNSILCKFLAIS